MPSTKDMRERMDALAAEPTVGNLDPYKARAQAIARDKVQATPPAALNWPMGYGAHSTFSAYKPNPTDPHSPWFLVMPGGSAVSFNHSSDDAIDKARVEWIAAVCNAALYAAPSPQQQAPK